MVDIWTALQARKRANPGAPLVTYLAGATGERVELSGTSVENAAAKIANALRGEFDLDHGSTISLRLPSHWQRAAWVAGAWTAGCALLVDDDAGDLVVMDELSALSYAADRDEVIAVSLHPFGLPIAATLPAGVTDATLAVRNQPDAYLFDPPVASLTAVRVDDRAWTQEDVWELAGERAREWNVSDGGRVLVRDDLDAIDSLVACLALPLRCNGSVVLAVGDVDVDQVVATEKVTTIAAPRQ